MKNTFLKATLFLTIFLTGASAFSNMCSSFVSAQKRAETRHIGVLIENTKTGVKHASFDAIVGSSHMKLIRNIQKSNMLTGGYSYLNNSSIKILWLGEAVSEKAEDGARVFTFANETSGLAGQIAKGELEGYTSDLGVEHIEDFLSSHDQSSLSADFTAEHFDADKEVPHLVSVFSKSKKFRHDLQTTFGVLSPLQAVDLLYLTETPNPLLDRQEFLSKVELLSEFSDVVKSELYQALEPEVQSQVDRAISGLEAIITKEKSTKPNWVNLNQFIQSFGEDFFLGLQRLQEISNADVELGLSFDLS